MSSRREDMLTEMGLMPEWRLRERDASVHAASAALGVEGKTAEEAPSRPHPAPPTTESADASSVPPAPDTGSRRASIMRMDWTALKTTVAQCRDCALHARRTNTVFGVGDEKAEWMFVGEGPGAEEDAKGEPFVGQAGRLLDNMLAAIDLKRGENVYIANTVKCRPPGNRNPEPEEALRCQPFLQRQIDLVRPKLIIALGRVSAQNLLARDASIASLRGRVHDCRGTPLIVTYHPAYLLRNLPDKAKAWEDLCFAVKTMQSLQSGRAAPT